MTEKTDIVDLEIEIETKDLKIAQIYIYREIKKRYKNRNRDESRHRETNRGR